MPICSIAAAISFLAMLMVLFPKLTVTTNCDVFGKTNRDSYSSGPNVVRYIPPDYETCTSEKKVFRMGLLHTELSLRVSAGAVGSKIELSLCTIRGQSSRP